jgi:hypothetical protein
VNLKDSTYKATIFKRKIWRSQGLFQVRGLNNAINF